MLKMDRKKTEVHKRNGIDSAQERNFWRALVNAVLSLRVPQAIELEVNV